TDLTGPTLDQLAFAHLLESGSYDRHVRHMRRLYLSRRQRPIAALNGGPAAMGRGPASRLPLFVPVADLAFRISVSGALRVGHLRDTGFAAQGVAECQAAVGPPARPGSLTGAVLGFASLSDGSNGRGAAVIAQALAAS